MTTNPAGAKEERDDRLHAELKAAQATVNQIRSQLGEPTVAFPPFPQNELARKIFAKPGNCPFCGSDDLDRVRLCDGDESDEEKFDVECCGCDNGWVESYRLYNVFDNEGNALKLLSDDKEDE